MDLISNGKELPQKFCGYDAESSASLYTGAKLNLGDRVLGEVEKNSFIALPGKGGNSRLLLSKTMCPHPGGFDEEFYSNSSRMELLTRLRCMQGLRLSGLLILMSLSGPFNLASGRFLAAPPLLASVESALWRSRKVMEAGVLPTRNGRQKGFRVQEPHRVLFGFGYNEEKNP